MSAELSALQTLAADYYGGWVWLSPYSFAVLFYATKFWKERYNWLSGDTSDTISDADWTTIEEYVDNLLYEAKNPMIGTIVAFVTTIPMTNVLECDGTTYLRTDFPALYDVIDTVYIVDSDHFKVPDLRGRAVIGVGTGTGLSARALNDSGGEETHQLTVGELASHSHTIPLTATTLAVEPGEVTVLTPVPLFTQDTGTNGSDTPHENMQPFTALKYGIIAS